MRIAINTRFLLSKKMEGFGWYTYEITKRLVENHPEHTFIFFFDRPYDPKFIFGDNVIPVVLHPQARHPILFKIWFNISVKRALKKYKADLFFSPDGYLSLTTEIPQIAVMHDLNFIHNPEDLKPAMRRYYLTQFPKFAQKARHIITVSAYSKKDILAQYNLSGDAVTAIWNGASDAFKPLDDNAKGKTRKTVSNGKPYILFVGAIHPRKNVHRLIEAFTLFKEHQPNSPLQLVIVGTALWNNAEIDISIAEPIKDDIHFTGHLSLDDLALVMGAAEIFAFVPYFEGFGIPLVEAMRCGIPIIAGNRTSLPEVAGEAAIYADPFNSIDISEKIARLANNEALRTELGQKGLKRSTLFSWDQAAEKVWEVIRKELDSH
jgi:glycosyltransferase involved in cell wall biosynthesis